MKFTGHGIVWDGEKNSVLCKFINKQYETEDEREIGILKGLGYEFEESEEDCSGQSNISNMKVADLKALCDAKEIQYDSKATKADLIKLLEGAE